MLHASSALAELSNFLSKRHLLPIVVSFFKLLDFYIDGRSHFTPIFPFFDRLISLTPHFAFIY